MVSDAEGKIKCKEHTFVKHLPPRMPLIHIPKELIHILSTISKPTHAKTNLCHVLVLCVGFVRKRERKREIQMQRGV